MILLRKCFVAQCWKISSGNLFLFQEFQLPKKVRDKRRGGNQDFLSKLFRLTVPNHFEVESFSVSLHSGIEKVCG